MDSVFFVLEIIGTIAFAISGSLLAIKKEMDLFGIIVLGVTTAVGGGIVRDIILGVTPPKTFSDPIYALTGIVTSIIVFVIISVKKTPFNHKSLDLIWFIFDTIGLATFSVAGVKVAYGISSDYKYYLLTFVGLITGVGGGILRDVFACDTPYILKKHFYACASIIGSFITAILWKHCNYMVAMFLGATCIIILRIFAAIYHWNLPKISSKN